MSESVGYFIEHSSRIRSGESRNTSGSTTGGVRFRSGETRNTSGSTTGGARRTGSRLGMEEELLVTNSDSHYSLDTKNRLEDLPDCPEQCETPLDAPPPKVPFWNPLRVAGIVAFCYLGVAARVLCGLFISEERFFQSDSYFLPNFIGSLILGFCFGLDLKRVAPDAHAALTVGFCGSLTTFSSWMLSVGEGKTPQASVVNFIAGVCFPFMAFFIGRDFAGAFPLLSLKHRAIDFVIVGIGWILLIVSIPTIYFTWNHHMGDIVYTSALGPIGALTRFALAGFLEKAVQPDGFPKDYYFPVGTILSNLMAFVLVAGLYNCGAAGNEWCNYASVGIGGSLSTVSTWVFDSVNIYNKAPNRGWGYGYALGTAAIGLAVCVTTVKGTIGGNGAPPSAVTTISPSPH